MLKQRYYAAVVFQSVVKENPGSTENGEVLERGR